MNPSKKEKIKMLNGMFDDLPDGAYLAAMEENGVTVEDLEAYAEDENAAKPKPPIPPKQTNP